MRTLLLGALGTLGLAAGLVAGGVFTTTLTGCCFCTNAELIEYEIEDADYEVREWYSRTDVVTSAITLAHGQPLVFELTDAAGDQWSVTYSVVDESWRAD